MRTYSIEIRVHFDSEEHYDIYLETIRQAAQQAYTTALLLGPKRTPQVALTAGDMFVKNEDIALFAENETTNEE